MMTFSRSWMTATLPGPNSWERSTSPNCAARERDGQHGARLAVPEHGHVDRHDVAVDDAVEEVGDDGAPPVAGARHEPGAPRHRKRGAEGRGALHERAAVRVEEQDVHPPLGARHPLAEVVEGPEVPGVEVLGLGERLERRDGRLELLVHRARHRTRRLPHAPLGGGELKARVVAHDEGGEAQHRHQRHAHEDDEVAPESHAASADYS